ncbi:hypothetical protein Emed_007155 [Eimeria media]
MIPGTCVGGSRDLVSPVSQNAQLASKELCASEATGAAAAPPPPAAAAANEEKKGTTVRFSLSSNSGSSSSSSGSASASTAVSPDTAATAAAEAAATAATAATAAAAAVAAVTAAATEETAAAAASAPAGAGGMSVAELQQLYSAKRKETGADCGTFPLRAILSCKGLQSGFHPESGLGHAAGSRIFQHYVLKQRIGCGSWGEVFVGVERLSGIQRAVKRIPKSTPHAVAMAREEVALLRELDHPNIVKVFDCFDDTAYFFVVRLSPFFDSCVF